MMSIVGGSMKIESVEGQYTRVILELPVDENTRPL
jgi:signal transduction histidine kinase